MMTIRKIAKSASAFAAACILSASCSDTGVEYCARTASCPPGQGGGGGATGGATTTSGSGGGGGDDVVGGGGAGGDVQCDLGTEKCPAGSCSELYAVGIQVDDAYWLNPEAATDAFRAYCKLKDEDGINGGWTLAMKIDGLSDSSNEDTLDYDSSLWTNGALLHEDSTDDSRINAKFQSWNTVPFEDMLVGMKSGDEGSEFSYQRIVVHE